METTLEFTPDDIAYIEENFVCPQARPAGPGPAYVLDDGSAFYPADYASQETDEARFKARLHAEAIVQQIAPLDAGETWQTYLEGIYGICLRSATPENIARKAALIQRIESLVSDPCQDDPQWVLALKRAVDALDALERPFSPHYDRKRFGRPPTRDSHIRDVRRRFPQIT
jgi:Family of unknown function (DUF6058)